jgi:hypothetical protein
MERRTPTKTATKRNSAPSTRVAWPGTDKHGFSIDLREDQLTFNAPSPKELLDTELRVHPRWIAARTVLEPCGKMQAVRDRALEILLTANEEPTGFRVTSPYAVITARRG